MPSLSEENYLKAIFHAAPSSGGRCSTNELASILDTRPASVTEMIKKLARKGLVEYQRYHGAWLTPEGKEIAIAVVRKHRLWEYFLVEKLGFGWDQVHDVAEELEHISSPELTDRLEEYLDYPRFDPHGDPIPDRNGEMEPLQQLLLSEVAPSTRIRIMGVAEHSPEFLQQLERMGLLLGSVWDIVECLPYDSSMQLSSEDGMSVMVSARMARALLVSREQSKKEK